MIRFDQISLFQQFPVRSLEVCIIKVIRKLYKRPVKYYFYANKETFHPLTEHCIILHNDMDDEPLSNQMDVHQTHAPQCVVLRFVLSQHQVTDCSVNTDATFHEILVWNLLEFTLTTATANSSING